MCQAKNWGLRPQLTTCASQMSIQRKEGCSSFQTPEQHRLRVPGRFHTGRQVGTAAQEDLVGSCTLLHKPLPL